MSDQISRLYSFVFRGLLAEEALDNAGRANKKIRPGIEGDISKILSMDLLDDELVMRASEMATVYTVMAAFENSVRKLISTVLLEHEGENWWVKCVSEKIRNKADLKMKDEEKIRWHSQRGGDPINYTLMGDLSNIIRQNWTHFEPYIPSIEWADSMMEMIERSRNVIMHSGSLDKTDVERIGIFIRDWVKQVGV
jgi:hypothetical protein